MDITEIEDKYPVKIELMLSPVDVLKLILVRAEGLNESTEKREEVKWLDDNNIEYHYKSNIFRFLTNEDAMAFKLRWC